MSRLTVDERAQLCDYAEKNPNLKQPALIQWVFEKFGKTISQPTVSYSLKRKAEVLDFPEHVRKHKVRRRDARFPVIEKSIYNWLSQSEEKIVLSAELLRRKATEFWNSTYPDLEPPKWSNGWMDRFKKRYGITMNVAHGKPAKPDTEATRAELERVIKEYAAADIYNCDETGLNYKLTPWKKLSIKQVEGKKLFKDRFTLLFCCNRDGSHKVKPWFIGTASKHRSFGDDSIEKLGCAWRKSKKAWMTSEIFREWLLAFDRDAKSRGRNVLLLMDKASVHKRAVDMAQATSSLTNTKVCFLPMKSDSKLHPLHQGIIRSFKAHYRKQWLSFIFQAYETGRSPDDEMNERQAVLWSTEAWERVSQSTMEKSWDSSFLYDIQQDSLPADLLVKEMSELISALSSKHADKTGDLSATDIDAFIEPTEERIDGPFEDTNTDLSQKMAAHNDTSAVDGEAGVSDKEEDISNEDVFDKELEVYDKELEVIDKEVIDKEVIDEEVRVTDETHRISPEECLSSISVLYDYISQGKGNHSMLFEQLSLLEEDVIRARS